MTEFTPNVHLVSERARVLFQGGALNAVFRDATQLAGEGFIAERFPIRWQMARAVQLGYVLSNRVDPWSRKDPSRWPPTYRDRKRQWQGHDDAMAWTGRLRASVWRSIRATAVATKGQARGEILYGRLNVSDPKTGAEGDVMLPPNHVVRRVLTAMPADDERYLADQFLAVVAERVQAQGAPARTASRLGAEPATIADRRRRLASRTLDQGRLADAQRAGIARAMGDRRAAIHSRLETWRQTAGGSAPIASTLGRARSAVERRQAHNDQSRLSYQRNRASILVRRRFARSIRRGLSSLRQQTPHR